MGLFRRRRQTALASCDGYESGRLVEVVFRKTLALRDSLDSLPTLEANLLRPLTALSLVGKSGIRVLDFGGACGAHFFVAHKLSPLELEWRVVETPAMAERARRLESESLRFFDLVEKASEGFLPDLVFSSGALQYTPEPLDYLRRLAGVGAPLLFLTRLELSESSGEVKVQSSMLSANGPGRMPEGVQDCEVRYPVNVVSRRKFEDVLAESYRVAARVGEEGGLWGYVCFR